MLWPFLRVIIAFLKPDTFTFFPLVIFVLFCLLTILILVTFTLKIFSIFFFKFTLSAPAGTLKTTLFCSYKLVDFSVTIGEIILSYKCILSILRISLFQFFYRAFCENNFFEFNYVIRAKMIYISHFNIRNISCWFFNFFFRWFV